MVVPVLITSCQVSEYLNTGPVTAQIIIVTVAMINAAELPVAAVAQFENLSNKFFFFFMLLVQANMYFTISCNFKFQVAPGYFLAFQDFPATFQPDREFGQPRFTRFNQPQTGL